MHNGCKYAQMTSTAPHRGDKVSPQSTTHKLNNLRMEFGDVLQGYCLLYYYNLTCLMSVTLLYERYVNCKISVLKQLLNSGHRDVLKKWKQTGWHTNTVTNSYFLQGNSQLTVFNLMPNTEGGADDWECAMAISPSSSCISSHSTTLKMTPFVKGVW